MLPDMLSIYLFIYFHKWATGPRFHTNQYEGMKDIDKKLSEKFHS